MLATECPLSPRDRAALRLALGESTDQAARIVGVDGSTVRRWRTDESFRDEVRRVRRRLMDEAVRALVTGAQR